MPAWYESFLADVAADEATYLACGDCDGATLPPRTVCPACGGGDLQPAPLPETGTVLSFTTIHVTIPRFHGETPYAVALVDFEPGVRLTAQVVDEGVSLGDASPDDEGVSLGDEVRLDVDAVEEGRFLVAVPV